MQRVSARAHGALFGPVALLALLATLALAACGSDGETDEGAEDSVTTAESSDGAAETSEQTDDAPDDGATDTTPADDTAAAAGDDGATGGSSGDVTLVEWAIDAPTSYQAGEVSFIATNDGNFPHELAIARGESYDTLPQTATGAVDEPTLGADFLGRVERISPGQSATLTLDLEPGSYVIFCNLGSGPSSHAANGQVLSITVEG